MKVQRSFGSEGSRRLRGASLKLMAKGLLVEEIVKLLSLEGEAATIQLKVARESEGEVA